MHIVLGRLASRARLLGDEFLYRTWSDIVTTFGGGAPAEALTRWYEPDSKPLVLLLDEIDSLIGDTLVLVLRQLRDGYDQRPESFPHSGDFTEAEVRALLAQHTPETGQMFTPEALDTVRPRTQGPPWLVNALCAQACPRPRSGLP